MKKIILSSSLILIFVIYILFQHFRNEVVFVAPSTANENKRSLSSPSKSFSESKSIYQDGEYIGNVADAYYGNVQVKVFVQNGKIADVQFLQYPNDRRVSIQINTKAMPYLKAEAIQAQSAEVDIVSGATQTSEAFRESLATALDQAKNRP